MLPWLYIETHKKLPSMMRDWWVLIWSIPMSSFRKPPFPAAAPPELLHGSLANALDPPMRELLAIWTKFKTTLSSHTSTKLHRSMVLQKSNLDYFLSMDELFDTKRQGITRNNLLKSRSRYFVPVWCANYLPLSNRTTSKPLYNISFLTLAQ